MNANVWRLKKGIQGVCPKRIFTENDAQTIKNIWKGKKWLKILIVTIQYKLLFVSFHRDPVSIRDLYACIWINVQINASVYILIKDGK